jgi:N-acetylglutamate synthase-like GNAT family acetyltransferase
VVIGLKLAVGGGRWLLTFVRATTADHDRIREFLSQFLDDYLSERFPQYLGRQPGGLYLAMDGDQLVGTCVISFPKAKQALLSGMRILPARQGSGVGEEFGRFQLAEARKLGADVVRVLVHQDNQTSAHVLQDKLGFQIVDQWAVGEINPLPNPETRPPEASMAWAVDRDRVASFIKQYEQDLWAPEVWDPVSLNLTDLNLRFETGGVAVAPQHGDVEALAFTSMQSKEVLNISYLRTLGQAVQGLLDYLWNEARAWGINRCRFGVSAHAAERLRSLVPNTEITWRGLVLERHLNLTAAEG